MAEWQIIFTIGASVYIASGVVFCIFGTGEMQRWNNIKSTHQGHANEGFEKTEEGKPSRLDVKESPSRFTVTEVQEENTKI